jgi:uncharacterized membrane protein YbaN (DUF454 family)
VKEEPKDPDPASGVASGWLKAFWLVAGWFSLVVGFIGVFLPVLPTVPFILLAAFCFSRGSIRCERWLLGHPQFGPWIRDWRAHRAVPLRAKLLATLMMVVGAAFAGFLLPLAWCWVPAAFSAVVAAWLWRLPHGPKPPDAALDGRVSSIE